MNQSVYRPAFQESKYAVIRGFYSEYDVMRMARRMDVLYQKGMLTQDPQCPKSYSVYSDPVHSEMQEKYRYKLSELIGVDLLPTYTYARIYSPREVLKWHSDRPSCEISLTSTLYYDTWDGEPWDIWVENKYGEDTEIVSEHNGLIKTKGTRIKLYPGDILVYRGCEVKHWRQEFRGIKQTQVFIHHVDANGPYSEYKYDCRPSLGSSVLTKDEAKITELNRIHDNVNKTHQIIQ